MSENLPKSSVFRYGTSFPAAIPEVESVESIAAIRAAIISPEVDSMNSRAGRGVLSKAATKSMS
jgi:hypothetical protein